MSDPASKTQQIVDTFTWDDAPPAIRMASKWDPIVETLKEHPGQWARFGPLRNTAVTAHLKKRYGLEAAGRKVDGEHYVWARYVNGTEA